MEFKIKIRLAAIFGLVSLCLVLPAKAAVLSLDLPKDTLTPGETVVSEVRLWVGSAEKVNAVEAQIKYPADILEAVDYSTGNSILTFIVPPVIGNGGLNFAGIIPGGFGGTLPGDQGTSNLLLKVIFKVKDKPAALSGRFNFSTTGSSVLLNDGKGTPAQLEFRIPEFKIVTSVKGQAVSNEWEQELKKDIYPPEVFYPEIYKSNGEHFLAFSAKDKNSGIDYYEISEEKGYRVWGKVFYGAQREWHKMLSPYLLQNQKLTSNILIKAVDKAGNERTMEVVALNLLPWYADLAIWEVFGMIFVFILIYLIWKRKIIKI